MRLVTTLVASEVERVRAPARASQEASAAFLRAVLARELADADEILARGDRARHRPRLAAAASSSPAPTRTCRSRRAGAPRVLATAERGARAVVPTAIAAPAERETTAAEVVVLVPGGDDAIAKRAAEGVLRELQAGLPGHTFAIGRSRVALDPLDLHRAGNEALLAVNVAEGDEERPLLAFEQTGAYRLLLSAMSEDPAELQRFYAETVEPLVAYDEQYETELVRTVEAFLDNDGNVAGTAQKLFTHRHTIRYRLERVRELSGLDVGSTDGREKLSLGLKAMRVLGVAAPGGPATEPGAGAGRVPKPLTRRANELRSRAMRIGILTGSGTYALPGIEADGEPELVETRFGSAPVTSGRFAGVDVLHVSRHRPGHELLSSQVTHQANIAALKERGADAILSVTVCGALDASLSLGSLVVFDDLHFLANRLPDGSICTLFTEPGEKGRGHWIYERPFSQHLREALLAGAEEAGNYVVDGGCYGHVDGPRFNTKTEIRMLQNCGVTVVSQTAGPETVLAGEAEIPYALLGYATDYANGVKAEATPGRGAHPPDRRQRRDVRQHARRRRPEDRAPTSSSRSGRSFASTEPPSRLKDAPRRSTGLGMPTRATTRPLRARAVALAAVALALWPAAASAWGPPRSGGFGPSVMRGGAGADFLRGAEGPRPHLRARRRRPADR